MVVDVSDANIERFVRLSGGGNVVVMLPENKINYELSPGAIGRIQYYNKDSNVYSNYGTLFIKEVTDRDGVVLEPEDYAFFGSREIKLDFDEKDEGSKVYGEIVLGTDEVPSSEILKVLIEFM